MWLVVVRWLGWVQHACWEQVTGWKHGTRGVVERVKAWLCVCNALCVCLLFGLLHRPLTILPSTVLV